MIRNAKVIDFNSIVKIYKEVQLLHAINEPNIFKFVEPLDFKTFKEILKKQNIKILVSEDKDIINGFLLGLIIEEESNLTLPRKLFAIESIAVLKELQNKNIGKQLINTAKDIANYEKCDSLILDVWSFNKKAIGFYNHLGFKEKKIRMELDL